MGVKIKICGLTEEREVELVNRLRPDYVGFIVGYPRSRRSVSAERAAFLAGLLSPEIKSVGVFVDEEAAKVCEYSDGVFDAVQLHGGEDNGYIERLRGLTNVEIIKAFVAGEGASAAEINASLADYVLIDGGRGEGKGFDRGVLCGIERDFWLAGGITPENVAAAARDIKPYGIDVSGGVETDGKKDYEKMLRLIRNARSEVKE